MNRPYEKQLKNSTDDIELLFVAQDLANLIDALEELVDPAGGPGAHKLLTAKRLQSFRQRRRAE